MEIQNYRDCGYTCNPHKFEIPAVRFPCRVPVIPCKNLQCTSYVHSPSKCLAWVKICCHVCLDQNFDPSLLTNKIWLVFLGKKIQNGRLKKTEFFKISNSQYFFGKISWIDPWISRIDCCKGHWCGSTYMAVRLSDISSKMA